MDAAFAAHQRLVIVSGASGALGVEYLRHYSQDSTCVGLFRSDPPELLKNVQYHRADLSDRQAIRELLHSITLLGPFTDVVLVHPVGKFKWEEAGPQNDQDGDGIDDEIYHSNVVTFENLSIPLLQLQQSQGWNLILLAFGSLSDRENVPFWQSYTKAKNRLRRLMKEIGSVERRVFCKFVNLPTVSTGNENRTRPHADQTFWMSPKEVVEATIDIVEDRSRPFQEEDRFRVSPLFWVGYYADHKAIYRNWYFAMHGEHLPETSDDVTPNEGFCGA